ncbi:MAG: tyrosine-type recombinase/integrase [Clostridiales bacterium]
MDEKKYLEYLETKNLSEMTRKTYLKRLKYYFKNPDEIKTKDKKYINQVKMSVQYFYNMHDEYYNDEILELRKLHNKAKRKKRKPEKTLYLKKVNQKINLLPGDELRKKLAFRLQQISGLRISEISNLEKSDIEFSDNNRLIVTVRHGKGNKRRVIKTIKDKFVYEKLKELEPRENNKVFHSSITLMKKAQRLGFKSHRLRKVFADQINLKVGDTKLLQKALGHEDNRNRTYKRYINTDINYNGTRFDI